MILMIWRLVITLIIIVGASYMFEMNNKIQELYRLIEACRLDTSIAGKIIQDSKEEKYE